MTQMLRLFPEYEAIDKMVFVFIDEFYNERFGFGTVTAELTRLLTGVCSVEILAKPNDMEALRQILARHGVSDGEFTWTPEAPPDVPVEVLFGHDDAGHVVGITYEYLRNHKDYEPTFRECEEYATDYVKRSGFSHLEMPVDFGFGRVVVSDSLALVSDYHDAETLRWLDRHVTQECVPFPYLTSEPSRDLDIFILPLSDTTWLVTQFDESHEERRTSERVIAMLKELNRDVVTVPGLPRVAHDDVNCIPNYANSVLANGLAIVPQYGRSEDEVALRVISESGYDSHGVEASQISESNYVFHCMTTAVPLARNSSSMAQDQ